MEEAARSARARDAGRPAAACHALLVGEGVPRRRAATGWSVLLKASILLGLASVTILLKHEHESLHCFKRSICVSFQVAVSRPHFAAVWPETDCKSRARNIYIYITAVLAAMSGVALGTSMNKRAASYSRSAGVLPGRYDAAADRGQCAICMIEFAENDKLTVLPCAHEFHSACVCAWLQLAPTCPLCRASTGV